MSLAEMRAVARRNDWPVDTERVPMVGGGELIRLWSIVDGARLMADAVAAQGREDAVLDELAARFLFWWRNEGG